MQKCESKLSLEYKQLSLLTNLTALVLNTNQPEREIYIETVKGEVFDIQNIPIHKNCIFERRSCCNFSSAHVPRHSYVPISYVRSRFRIRINFMRIQIRIRAFFRGLKTFQIKKSVFC
jgi:hypothetical protein